MKIRYFLFVCYGHPNIQFLLKQPIFLLLKLTIYSQKLTIKPIYKAIKYYIKGVIVSVEKNSETLVIFYCLKPVKIIQ